MTALTTLGSGKTITANETGGAVKTVKTLSRLDNYPLTRPVTDTVRLLNHLKVTGVGYTTKWKITIKIAKTVAVGKTRVIARNLDCNFLKARTIKPETRTNLL